MPTNVDDFLAHYGVKGMRWGVRKERKSIPKDRNQNPDNSNRKKKLIVAGSVAASVVLAAGITYAAVQGRNYSKEKTIISALSSMRDYNDNDYKPEELISKGSVFFRAAASPETSITNGRSYVTTNLDKIGHFSKYGPYDVKMQAIKDIRTPSYKQRIDALASTLTKDQIQGITKNKSLGARIAKSKADPVSIATIEYRRLHKNGYSTPEAKSFLGELFSRGFSAIRDDNYAESYGSTVLFDNNSIKFLNSVKSRVMDTASLPRQ